MRIFFWIIVIFCLTSCSQKKHDTQAHSSPTGSAGVSQVNHDGNCNQLNIKNQALYGPKCLIELYDDISPRSRIKNIDSLYIDLNQLKNMHRITPDFIGVNLFFYKAKLHDDDVFVKVSAAANLDWILKNWRVWEAHQKTHLQFFNEIYWAQKLAEADLGPNFFGVTFMEINEESSGVQIKEKPFALISSYIEGKTYKVPHGILVPPNASKEHKEAIEALVPKLNNFIKDNHAAVIDLQYMVDQNNRAWVIDPEQWSLNI